MTFTYAGRVARRGCLGAALVLTILGSGALASSALAAPKWGITMTRHNAYGQQGGVDPFTGSSTAFDRLSGANAYEITVSNVAPAGPGNEVSETANVVVEDTLPEGLLFAGSEGQIATSTGGWHCTIESIQVTSHGVTEEKPSRKAKCKKLPKEPGQEVPIQLAPGKSYPPLVLNTWVEPTANESLVNSATVSGGEASPPSETTQESEGRTTIDPAVPFGIFSFTMGDLATEGEPFTHVGAEPQTQAGAHPLAVSTNMTFNFTPNLSGGLVGAGGGAFEFGVGPKSVEAELPPGLIGNPQSAGQCAIPELLKSGECEPDDTVGYLELTYTQMKIASGGVAVPNGPRTLVYNMKPPSGHPAAFGFVVPTGEGPNGRKPFVLFPKLRSDGNYGFTVGDEFTGPLRTASFTFCSYGVETEFEGGARLLSAKCREHGTNPYLTNPTQCSESLSTTLEATPYPEESGKTRMKAYFNGSSAEPAELGVPGRKETVGSEEGPKGKRDKMEGCAALKFDESTGLKFEPSSAAEGGSTQADSPTGMTLHLTIPQKEEVEVAGQKLVPPELKGLKMTLPAGLTVSPSGADGLAACSAAQFGLGSVTEPAQEANCPPQSQIGTVSVYTPLLPPGTGEAGKGHGQLEGELYAGPPECNPCSQADAESGRIFKLFLQLKDKSAGLVVKLRGAAAINHEGRMETSFQEQPPLPFEELVLHLKGGPRASLATPQGCGAATTETDFTPWSTPFTQDLHTASAFNVEGCEAKFSPSLSAGTEYPSAGRFSSFSLTVGRNDKEGNIQNLQVRMPPGLTAKLAGVPLCGEAQANAGTCPAGSQVGTVLAGAGSGPHPYFREGQAYLTGPLAAYPGDPFGLSIVVPAEAGPYNLGKVVSISGIAINESTAAVTVTTNGLPQSIDGVPLRIKAIHVNIDRGNFERNPTNCTPQGLSATITSTVGQVATPSSPFDVGSCGSLGFSPAFTATTQAKTSRTEGASLVVKIAQKEGEANIHRVNVQLPLQLPSRLSTLQHACTEAQFAAQPNAQACPPQSFVGTATGKTPLLAVPLTGPAVLISHGGEEFPDLHFLLQGEGIKIDVVGHTQIKNGITYSKFETVPDQPIESFETAFPEGPHSILAANGNLCKQTLKMPTIIEGQDGAQVSQTTTVSVSGCPKPKPLTRAQKLRKALKACRKKDKGHKKARLACERRARKKYGPKSKKHSAKGKKSSVAGASGSGSPVSLPSVVGSAVAGAREALVSTTTSAATRSSSAGVASPSSTVRPCSETNAGLGISEEQVRRETSNTNLATHQPYSSELPGCRAFELVSPGEKQGHETSGPEVVAPEGGVVGYASEGAFENPANFYLEGEKVRNTYTSKRQVVGGVAAWVTTPAFAPASLILRPNLGALSSEFSPDLESAQISCGMPPRGGYACAVRAPDGSWRTTAAFTPAAGITTGLEKLALNGVRGEAYAPTTGFSKVVVEPGFPLLKSDHARLGGIYEIVEPAGAAQARLLNVDEHGVELHNARLGDSTDIAVGTAYNAISESGERIFFSGSPTGGHQTVYARESKPGQEPTTVPISNPEECKSGEARCEAANAKPATYQGASKDGSRVFFTTTQDVLPGETDATTKLYEYEFQGEGVPPKVTLLSKASDVAGARVQGLLRNSADGSHAYFVAEGVLTSAPDSSLPAGHQTALKGAENLYAVDTTAEGGPKVSFIGTLPNGDHSLWGRGCSEEVEGENAACDSAEAPRDAQVTPDGDFVVFNTSARLSEEDANGCTGSLGPSGTIEVSQIEVCSAQAVYRYDALTGRLTWVSHSAPGFLAKDEHDGASLFPQVGNIAGATAAFEDTVREISNDGRYIAFTTKERLQEGTTGSTLQAYLWECSASCAEPQSEGTVALVSGGQGETSARVALSASGHDVFFETNAQLVPQDADEFGDVYDARIGGGIPVESAPTCAGEACQGTPSTLPQFGLPGSALFTGGHNLAQPATVGATGVSDTTVKARPKGKKHKPKKKQKKPKHKSKRRH